MKHDYSTKLSSLTLGMFLVFGTAVPLGAQAACVGTTCSNLPFNQNSFNNLYFQFQSQYANKLFDGMAQASTLANITGPPIGTVNLQEFTVGFGAGIGYVPFQKGALSLIGFGIVQDAITGGVYGIPRIFAGANLGWLIGSPYDPDTRERSPSFLSPARFDLYVQAIDHRRQDGFDHGNIKADAELYTRGFDIRYHLVEGSPITDGGWLRFLGVSVGAGYHLSRVSLNIEQYAKYRITAENGVPVTWEGTNYIDFQSALKSYPVEIVSGLQFLNFLSLSLGMGVATNSGYANIHLTRAGPMYRSSDQVSSPLSTLGLRAVPVASSSFVVLNIPGGGHLPRYTSYFKFGLDLSFWRVKVFVEAIRTGRSIGANVGTRVQ